MESWGIPSHLQENIYSYQCETQSPTVKHLKKEYAFLEQIQKKNKGFASHFSKADGVIQYVHQNIKKKYNSTL